MIRINLVPQEILDRELQRQRAAQAGVAGCLALVVVLGASLAHWSRAGRLERHLAERLKELDRLKVIVAEVEQLESTANAVKARLAVITELVKGRPLYPYFMADFARTLPPGVWLSSLGTSDKGGNQLGVNAAALASSSEDVSAWLRTLERSGKFQEPALSAVSISDRDGTKVHSFSITTTYKHPEL